MNFQQHDMNLKLTDLQRRGLCDLHRKMKTFDITSNLFQAIHYIKMSKASLKSEDVKC